MQAQNYQTMQDYSRDKRSPKPKNNAVSRSMSGNKAKDTKPELLLRKALWAAGHKGYRLHVKHVPGRPDIVFTLKKIAVFVNGCFWHRCPYCQLSMPKNNIDFWTAKFEKNCTRDKQKVRQLKKTGWQVIIVWECELKKDKAAIVKKIRDKLTAYLDRTRPNAFFTKRVGEGIKKI